MLRVSDLRIKTKNKEIVKGISFTVKDGDFPFSVMRIGFL